MGVAAGRLGSLGCVLLVAAAGCGPRLYPVHGQVSFPDGKPVTAGMVVFESKDQDKPVTARGQIGADGRYELGTYKPGDGAPPGKYQVLVAPKSDPNAVDKPNHPPPFDPAYSAFSTSRLVFDVTAGGPNEFPIQVSKHKKVP